MIAQCTARDILRFFRADAAYAIPAIYARLEEAGDFYAIRLPVTNVLREKIANWLTRPVGRPSLTELKRSSKISDIRRRPGKRGAVSSPRSNGTRPSCSQKSAAS